MGKNLMADWTAPYVHSTIDNFHRGVNGYLSEVSIQGYGRLEIEEQLQELTRIRDFLKAEAQAFYGDKNLYQYKKKISYNDTYAKIGLEIIKSSKMEQIITQTAINSQLQNIKKNSNITNQKVLSLIDTYMRNNIGIDDLVSQVANYTFNKMQRNKIHHKGELLSMQMKLLQKDLGIKDINQFQIAEEIKKPFLKNSKRFQEVIKDAILNNSIDTIQKDVINAIYIFFEREFREKTKNNTYRTDQTVDEYLKEFKQNLYKIKQINFKTANLRGQLGEDFVKIVFNSDTEFKINVEVVGDKSEEALIKRLSNLVKKEMETHHEKNKFSQTDLIFTNSKTGKSVRVQSKNLQSAYRQLMNNPNKSYPGLAQIQSTTEYIDLINNLRDSKYTTLTDNLVQQLSYLLANEAWFRNHTGYPGRTANKEHAKKTNEKVSRGELSKAHELVERILSLEVANLIGAVVAIGMEPTDSAASSANVFFLVSDSYLLPTYVILDDVIRRLQYTRKFLKDRTSAIRITLLPVTNVGKSRDLYMEKLAVVGGKFNKKLNYQNSNLVRVGQEKGEEILQNLNIKRINLRIDLKKMSKSAYNMYGI